VISLIWPCASGKWPSALLVVFAATVLNAALTLRLVDPSWLQGLI
jgi:hypothetical protein